jgi:hypothetical protein
LFHAAGSFVTAEGARRFSTAELSGNYPQRGQRIRGRRGSDGFVGIIPFAPKKPLVQ